MFLYVIRFRFVGANLRDSAQVDTPNNRKVLNLHNFANLHLQLLPLQIRVAFSSWGFIYVAVAAKEEARASMSL